MRLVCQENLVGGEGLAEKATRALAAGFDGLELRDAGLHRAAEVAAARAAGAVVASCCPEQRSFIGDFDPTRRGEAIRALEGQLSGLARLGGEVLITPAAWGMFSLRLPPFAAPRPPAEDDAVLLDGLRRLAAHAESQGVSVLLEPLNRYEDHMVNTLARGIELVQAVGSPALRMLADTYHMNIEEDDPPAALRAAAPWLGEVHLSDSNRHQPGTGHVPFADVLATLHDAGFDGLLAIECRWRGDPATALAQTGATLRARLEALG